MDTFDIHYRFAFDGNLKVAYTLKLDSYTLELKNPPSQVLPDWTCLEFQQCPNCPLRQETSPRCPVAENLEPLITGELGDLSSYTDVHLEVITEQRTVSSRTTLQRGISSLSGLIMATSACPHTRFLRPMARFHLPLATDEETTYRAASMYLLGQYFLYQDGKTLDLDLDGLKRNYQSLQAVNTAMARRIRRAGEQDATVNAVVLLDLLAKNLPYSIDESLEEIRYLFE